jgi:hypothetical protein
MVLQRCGAMVELAAQRWWSSLRSDALVELAGWWSTRGASWARRWWSLLRVALVELVTLDARGACCNLLVRRAATVRNVATLRQLAALR